VAVTPAAGFMAAAVVASTAAVVVARMAAVAVARMAVAVANCVLLKMAG